ncbi:MAG TPA: glycerate kinase [Spirochaetota bacterium]|nr:glycerate kinase [Spirochaetota bacterium]
MNNEKAFAILESIFQAGLRRVDPYLMIKELLKVIDNRLIIDTKTERHEIDLNNFKRVFVTGMGKASGRMALAIEDIFGGMIDSGVVAVKYGHVEKLQKIELIEAGHPVPDENSVKASASVIDLVKNLSESDLVINLVSGGGSAVLCSPYSNDELSVSLSEKQSLSRLLFSCGAEIHEINCLRKHLSNIKGGRLAEMIYPATCISLILSDVVGDNLDVIASGATVPDSSTFVDAIGIIEKYGIESSVPKNIMEILNKGAKGEIPETPKVGSPIFNSVKNILIGTNYHALLAASQEARRLGFKSNILTSMVTGEAREIAHFFAGIARDLCRWSNNGDLPICIIAGGETTVTLKGKGMGGRCQEMALSFLNDIRKSSELDGRVFFLAAGTDGNDGPTDASGAFASMELYSIANDFGLVPEKFIQESDSYHFFEKINGLFKTGPTGTNVCDIYLMIVV